MNLSSFIDHTLLKADATEAQIQKLCEEARTYGFYSVCVNPCWVQTCRYLLKDSGVKVCAVVGFPLGANAPEIKAAEAEKAVEDGASEIDMVLNIGALKAGNQEWVYDDIIEVRSAVPCATLKVILETCLLNQDEIILACKIAKEACAEFVKTSTGFSSGGATVEDIRLMRQAVGPNMGVKASGGIRDRATALAMIEAGASRLGCSASVAIAGDG